MLPVYNCTWKSTQGIEAQATIFNKNRPFHNPGSFFTFLKTNITNFPLIFRYIYLTTLNLETSIKNTITKLLSVKLEIKPVYHISAFLISGLVLKVIFRKSNSTNGYSAYRFHLCSVCITVKHSMNIWPYTICHRHINTGSRQHYNRVKSCTIRIIQVWRKMCKRVTEFVLPKELMIQKLIN